MLSAYLPVDIPAMHDNVNTVNYSSMMLGWSTTSTGGKPACVLHLGEIEINKIHLEDFFFQS